MNDSLLLIVTALAAGFFGSPHCFGMCGGIVSALGFALKTETPRTRLVLQTTYHAGRLVSYTFLGLLVGLLGQGILAPLMNSRWPYVLTAVMMVLFGLYLSGWWTGLNKLEALGSLLWQWMTPLRKRFIPINSIPRALMAGMLWGFLPCGLIYSALALAMTSGHAGVSALAMLAFGLGTLPMMLMTGSAAAELKEKLNKQGWRAANGLLVISFGVWTLLQAYTHDESGHAHHHHDAMTATASPSGIPAAATTQPAPPLKDEHHDMSDMDMDAMTDEEMAHSHHHHNP